MDEYKSFSVGVEIRANNSRILSMNLHAEPGGIQLTLATGSTTSSKSLLDVHTDDVDMWRRKRGTGVQFPGSVLQDLVHDSLGK